MRDETRAYGQTTERWWKSAHAWDDYDLGDDIYGDPIPDPDHPFFHDTED